MPYDKIMYGKVLYAKKYIEGEYKNYGIQFSNFFAHVFADSIYIELFL